MYIVKYSAGSYDDYSENVIFVTKSKVKASRYILKFNNILKKWKDYYEINKIPEYGTAYEILFFKEVNRAWAEVAEER
jgi:hypothetical protein